MEYTCWVCGTPFDESKPVKLLQKEEKQIIVEEKSINKKEKITFENLKL